MSRGSRDVEADVRLALECDHLLAARLGSVRGWEPGFLRDLVGYVVEATLAGEERLEAERFDAAVLREVERRTRREREEEEEDLVRCELCGKRYRSLGHHLAARHHLRAADYRRMVGLAPNARLTCQATHVTYRHRNLRLRLATFVEDYRFAARKSEPRPATPLPPTPVCRLGGEPLVTTEEQFRGVCRACLIPGYRLRTAMAGR